VLSQHSGSESAAIDPLRRSHMAREITRSWEGRTSSRLREKIEMLFAHLRRILELDRLRL
jgi:hypothetical protein